LIGPRIKATFAKAYKKECQLVLVFDAVFFSSWRECEEFILYTRGGDASLKAMASYYS
jgi:hypothetical protein